MTTYRDDPGKYGRTEEIDRTLLSEVGSDPVHGSGAGVQRARLRSVPPLDGASQRFVDASGDVESTSSLVGRGALHNRSLDGMRILIIENTDTLACLLQEALESAGACIVGVLHSDDAAIALACADTLDAIVIDVDPGAPAPGSGSLIKALDGSGTPCLLTSASNLGDTRYSHVPHLHKPYGLSDIVGYLTFIRRGSV